MLNLEWFRTFKAIYEAGSLSAAAQVLFISQPGVSLHLNSLESYTGYRLFEREPRRMIPTDRGTMLYNFINESINKLTEAEQLFHRNNKSEKPTVTVGMCFEIFQYTLEEHVSQLPFNLVVRFGEYPKMLHDLDTGVLDLIITSQKGQQANLEYTPFVKERIILICGRNTDTTEFDKLLQINNRSDIKDWLNEQTWYTTAADMEHLKNFWLTNFDCMPELKPNYVVPYFGSILKCLKNGKGFAVVPDFLCKQYLETNAVKLAWEGSPHLENILYFGKRKKTIYPTEIQQLEELLTKNWVS